MTRTRASRGSASSSTPRNASPASAPPIAPKEDSIVAARAAGLRWVTDADPGIRRRKAGGGFVYLDEKGKTIRDWDTLARIKALAIPPAWEDVWICPSPAGHIQATGRDARGRKQYRYHPEWRSVRDQDKYAKLAAFGRALPGIRRITRKHLDLPGLPRKKVLAAVVRIMERTLIRVGNDEYARNNNSYGLTTLRDKHARINGADVRFTFKGKSGISHQIDLHSPRLARIVRKCQDLPGYELFQYFDERGQVTDVTSGDVNDYLREIAGDDFTAKDFRTWAGTVLALHALRQMPPARSKAAAKRCVNRAVEAVSDALGNTRAVCRKCYVHPLVIDAYCAGELQNPNPHRARGLSEEESILLGMLRR